MIDIKNEGVLLKKTHLDFENDGVLNPAVLKEGDNVHVFYRAVQRGNYSSIGYCKLDGPLNISERWSIPFLVTEFDYESHGVEDPRIVKIDDLYHLTYTAYDGTNARGAVATAPDLIHFDKHGIIVPDMTYSQFAIMTECNKNLDVNYLRNHKFYYQPNDLDNKIKLWDKNVIFFPRRINGNLVFLHRIRPGIQIVSVKNLSDLTDDFWEGYFINFHKHIALDPIFGHESAYIGGGCPPIETEHGWLLIYHGVEKTRKGLVYSACASLLDLHEPTKEIARLPYALFSPQYEWELKGEVNNVCFPTGTALFGGTLFIYYGAADSVIACASLSLNALLDELLTYTGRK
jgi:beta-1,2-mannobiose phosphorylase / 1,2-beta-oligomannan phosphorylase